VANQIADAGDLIIPLMKLELFMSLINKAYLVIEILRKTTGEREFPAQLASTFFT
tara:strand:+ start:210 stop:374 length:165 start_codon:yes stop_codon:yes gene_type:complete